MAYHWTIQQTNSYQYYKAHGCGCCGNKTDKFVAIGEYYPEDESKEIIFNCRSCSSANKAWDKWEKEIVKAGEEELKTKAALKERTISLINSATYIDISEEFVEYQIIVS